MNYTNRIISAVLDLEKYIFNNHYRGYDPYDGLKSPLFNLPFLRTNKTIRFGFQQFIKRFPINLRSLLLIKKGYNPVTLGLCIQAYGYLSKIIKDRKEEFISKADYLIKEIEKLIPVEFSGACWGYDFDWESRYARIPAYQPAIVATGIITNAMFIFNKVTGNQKAKELLVSSANFVLNDVNRYYENNLISDNHQSNTPFCFSYSPFDDLVVYNASMKGSRLLMQAYSLTKDSLLLESAAHSIEFVIHKQNDNGSWFYSARKNGNWIDNYHTGYVLDCLSDYIQLSGDERFRKNLEHGIEYYINNLFVDSRIPKFYSNKTFPIDCTAAAQSILTLTKFGYIDIAKNIADYMMETMQDKDGHFYFRNYGKRTDMTSFMRWSNAWMLDKQIQNLSCYHYTIRQ